MDLPDVDGRTPLILAAGRGCDLSCGTLIDAGADMTAKTKKGSTAMTFAATNGKDDTAYYLYSRWTNSAQAPWRDRVKNPQFLFLAAILFAAGLANRQLLWEFFLDWWDPLPGKGIDFHRR